MVVGVVWLRCVSCGARGRPACLRRAFDVDTSYIALDVAHCVMTEI